jgi:hypothetical protein
MVRQRLRSHITVVHQTSVSAHGLRGSQRCLGNSKESLTNLHITRTL